MIAARDKNISPTQSDCMRTGSDQQQPLGAAARHQFIGTHTSKHCGRNIMKRLGIFILSALSLAFLQMNAPVKAQSLKQQLVGAWTFVSSTTKLPDGSPAWGANPKGLLIFTENGSYSSTIVRSNLPKFSSRDRAKGTPEENQAVVHGSIATFGTYAVDDAKKTFTVRFEGSTYPNNVGTEQTRPFTISGEELKITNPSASIGGTPSELVYKRAK
jgi:hypothetical protein